MEVNIPALIARHGLLSDQIEARELQVILNELTAVLKQSEHGAVVELGCYSGTTSVYIARILQEMHKPHEFHVYDSFVGLPEKAIQDQNALGTGFVAGALSVSKSTFVQNFKKAGLALPKIHKDWFADLDKQDIPDNICFAFLDSDYYQSIKDSLKLIEAKLAPNAVIVIDDYSNESLPGAAKAANQWVQNKNFKIRQQSSLAVIYTD